MKQKLARAFLMCGSIVALGDRARVGWCLIETTTLPRAGCGARGSSPRRLASLIDLPGLRARLLFGLSLPAGCQIKPVADWYPLPGPLRQPVPLMQLVGHVAEGEDWDVTAREDAQHPAALDDRKVANAALV